VTVKELGWDSDTSGDLLVSAEKEFDRANHAGGRM
jgi:hypothetical protein